MKAKTKIKTLLLGATLATAFATVGAYGLFTEYEVFNTKTITAGAVSAPYNGTMVEPMKLTEANIDSYGLPDSYVGYYAIKTSEELAWFAKYIDGGHDNRMSASAVLLDDIIYNAGTITADGASIGTTQSWNPIGDWGSKWYGTFDGNGHYVSGLYTKNTEGYTGFIGYTYGATVKNVTIKNSYFEDVRYLGGIVAISQEGTTITGCRVESNVSIIGKSSSNADWVGGIVGSGQNTTITDCYVAATVSGDRLTGAIIGENKSDNTMSNNYYIAGCTTAKGTLQNAVGINSSTGATVPDVAGQNTSIAAESTEHTCVPVTTAEVVGIYDAYTYCSVCGTILSIDHKFSYEGVPLASIEEGNDYYEKDIIEACANCTHEETLSIRIKDDASLVYSGSSIKPYELVYSDGWMGVKKTNADIVYLDNDTYSTVNAGTAQAYINLGFNGDGFDTTEYMLYKIQTATPTAANFMMEVVDGSIYNGETKSVTVTASSGVVGMGEITSTFYKNGLEVTEIKDVGEYTVKIDVAEGDNYTAITDLVVGTFTVKPYELSNSNVVLSLPNEVTYNGEEQKPTVSVVVDGKTLVESSDYDLSWDQDVFVKAGLRKVTVTGKGNYSGTGIQNFEIQPKAILDGEITIDLTEATYDSTSHQPTITVKDGDKTLEKDVDYSLNWDKTGFVDAGTYTATIEGKGNYSGSFTRVLIINKVDLVIELSSPIAKVLPNNQIALNLTVNSTEGTPVWTVVGGTHVSGTTIKVNDGLVIGRDKVEITVTYEATTNYTGGSESIELEVGMADFTAEIEALEEDVTELETLLAEKADATVVTEKLNEILGKVEALEEVKDAYQGADAALKADVEAQISAAKQQAIDAVQANLDQAIIDLNDTISTEDGKLDARITDEVKALSDAIDLAEQAAADADDALKADLEGQLAVAELTLQAAIDAVQTNLDDAVNTLNQTMADEDGKLDARITDEVKALSDAIDLAEQAAATADEALKADLLATIKLAKDTMSATINSVSRRLDEAVKELNRVIASGDKALAQDLAAAIEEVNAAIDLAEQISAENDGVLEAKLTKAQAALEEELKAMIQSNQEAIEAAREESKKNDILPTVLGGVGVAGNLALAIGWVISKRRKIK